jgi:diaminopimelate decarboxylase
MSEIADPGPSPHASRLAEIADAVGTPFYLYDVDVLRGRIARLRDALAGLEHLTCYAVKANDALALLAVAAEEGLGADIVSGGELEKALRSGFPADRIVFSGVGKTRPEIRAAIEAGVRSLNVESHGELATVADEARRAGRHARVGVRLNPDVTADTHQYVQTGSAESKFGLAFDEALAALETAAADPSLEPVGVSFHIGSNLFDLAPIAAAADRAVELWQAAAGRGIVLRDLDCGGGIGVRYDGDELVEVDVDAWASVLAKAAAKAGAQLVVEPGRWLTAPAGVFVARVLYTKDAPGRRIAVCDGAMNDLLRPALYGAYHPIEVVAEPRPRQVGTVDVVGPVCESGDFFALGRELPLPEPDDLLVIGLAGAYGRVMSSTYNARPLCAEVVLEGGAWRIARERGTVDDLVRGEAAPLTSGRPRLDAR